MGNVLGEAPRPVTIVLAPGCGPGAAPEHPRAGGRIAHGELADRHASRAGTAERVADFVGAHGLDVLDASDARRRVVARGTPDALESAFGIRFVRVAHRARHRDREFHGVEGRVRLPDAIAGAVDAVLGLDGRPAHPHGHAAVARATPLSPADLAAHYRFPEGTDGDGQVIGIVALAGGYHAHDMETFFDRLGVRRPEIVEVDVHESLPGVQPGDNRPAPVRDLHAMVDWLGGADADPPTPAAMATLETTMDVQLVAALAPRARIVVYFAPTDDEQGLWHALRAAVHDHKRRPGVLALSWGWPEVELADDAGIVRAVQTLMHEAAHAGITVCVATGDDAAKDAQGRPTVQYPSTSRYALACGGTELWGTRERVWDDTWRGHRFASTGGVSRFVPRPAWQDDVPLPGRAQHRGVPDVAALADRRHGCRIVVGGREIGAAGTSAAAPLWAALVARLGQAVGQPVGYINPWLYRNREALRCIRAGTNGYRARAPWNACAGLGVPDGEAMLKALED